MKTVFLVISVCLIVAVHGGLRNNGSTRAIFRRLSVLSLKAEIRENRENRGKGWWFPDMIECSLNIMGLGTRYIRANRLKLRSLRTKVMTMGQESQMREKYRISQDIGFYTNSDGSFACKPTLQDGRPRCDLFGIIHGDKESCFFHGEKAFCRKTSNTTGQVYDHVGTPQEHESLDPDKPYPGIRTDSREKRFIATPLENARVIQVAVYLDQEFMNDFYAFSPSNDEEAETMAEMYTKMTVNEMTYRYQNLKELQVPFRGGILDLAVNTATIIYPEKGSDFDFITKTGDFMNEVTLDDFGIYVNDNPPDPFNHAMLLTRLNMYQENDILGQAFISTVCSEAPDKQEERVSISEDREYNVAVTATHELGHALGAFHDEGYSVCAYNRYIMAAVAVTPRYITQNTLFRFSRCSAAYFRNHLESVPDCLSRASDEAFLENFCLGPRGQQENSLDGQCHTAIGFSPDAFECNGLTSVPPEGCWRLNPISCDPGDGGSCSSLQHVAEGTPCDGEDLGKNYYCYLGDCVEETELCPEGPPPTCFCDTLSTTVARNICCRFTSCC